MIRFKFSVLIILLFALLSCGNRNDDTNKNKTEFLSGEGTIAYNNILSGKKINIYYYIPPKISANTNILMVFHGAERNAIDYRNAWKTYAEAANWIVVAPEFTAENFPGGDGYNLGNMFVDGDNPNTSKLNLENEWLFSVIDPIFQFMKEKSGSKVESYNIYGHSAGAQVVQKFLMLPSSNHVNRAIISSAGWYTDPDVSISFPYGLKFSPLENLNFENYFSKKIRILIGAKDNNPNDSELRRNSIVDLQGYNRLERSQHFYSLCNTIALQKKLFFNWSYEVVPNGTHDFRTSMINASQWVLQN